jgi:hypothetical protein
MLILIISITLLIGFLYKARLNVLKCDLSNSLLWHLEQCCGYQRKMC